MRRSGRLERKKQEILNGTYSDAEPSVDLSELDSDDFNAEEIEEIEEELLDAATATQTGTELNAELIELADLTKTAKKVRGIGADRKWTELSTTLQDNALITDENGWPRKFIIFTEHRDTLDYLHARISSLIGKPDAVRAIHGGVRRGERRQITEEFTKNRNCQILLATDAAGEASTSRQHTGWSTTTSRGTPTASSNASAASTASGRKRSAACGTSLHPTPEKAKSSLGSWRSLSRCAPAMAARSSTSSVKHSTRPHSVTSSWTPFSTANDPT